MEGSKEEVGYATFRLHDTAMMDFILQTCKAIEPQACNVLYTY